MVRTVLVGAGHEHGGRGIPIAAVFAMTDDYEAAVITPNPEDAKPPGEG